MDLETENRLAALLMEEARRLRLESDKEGVGVYLRQPKVRGCPNARFLTATVLGVQQANRAVEVNEMWRAREKELDLEYKLSHRSKPMTRHGGERCNADLSKESASFKYGKSDRDVSVSSSSSKQRHKNSHFDEDDGLRDEEVEEFLQSRRKRGRGAIGSRMDEPGPYPVCTPDQGEHPLVNHELWIQDERKGQILGPEKPSWLPRKQPEEDSSDRETRREDHSSWKARKEDHPSRPGKRRHSKDKHSSEESSKKKKKDKQRHRHRS